MISNEINNSMDYIDSRDVIDRIEELQDSIDNHQSDIDNATSFDEKQDLLKEFDDFMDEYGEEYNQLKTLNAEGESLSFEWSCGLSLIHEDHFIEYCKDVGYISDNLPWFIEINWEKTAEHIKMDYNEIDFDGQTYFLRI